MGQGQRGREFAHVGSASALYLSRGWVCNKGVRLCKFLFPHCGSQSPPPPRSAFCQLEFASRTLYTFRRVIYLGSSEDRHDSVSFSFVCTIELAYCHLLPQSRRVSKCSTIPLELIFANRFSVREEKLSCFPGIGNFPPEISHSVHKQHYPNGGHCLLLLLQWEGNSVCSLQACPHLGCRFTVLRSLLTLTEAQTPAEWEGLCVGTRWLTFPLLWTHKWVLVSQISL